MLRALLLKLAVITIAAAIRGPRGVHAASVAAHGATGTGAARLPFDVALPLKLQQQALGRRRLFASKGTTGRDYQLAALCAHGIDGVTLACGRAPAGKAVPVRCSAWCTMVYPSWWLKCRGVRE